MFLLFIHTLTRRRSPQSLSTEHPPRSVLSYLRSVSQAVRSFAEVRRHLAPVASHVCVKKFDVKLSAQVATETGLREIQSRQFLLSMPTNSATCIWTHEPCACHERKRQKTKISYVCLSTGRSLHTSRPHFLFLLCVHPVGFPWT